MPRRHHITPVLKSLHWLKIQEHIHFKVLFLTYNSLQSSQPAYLRELFTIQSIRSTLSSSSLTLSLPPPPPRPPLSSSFFPLSPPPPRSLLISCSPNRAISITDFQKIRGGRVAVKVGVV